MELGAYWERESATTTYARSGKVLIIRVPTTQCKRCAATFRGQNVPFWDGRHVQCLSTVSVSRAMLLRTLCPVIDYQGGFVREESTREPRQLN